MVKWFRYSSPTLSPMNKDYSCLFSRSFFSKREYVIKETRVKTTL